MSELRSADPAILAHSAAAPASAPAAPAPAAAPAANSPCVPAILADLNALRDMDLLLSRSAELLQQEIAFDSLAVLLYDPVGQHLKIRHGVGYPAEVVQHWRFGPGQGLVGQAAASGRALRMADIRGAANAAHPVAGTRAELAVPLVVQGRTVGVLDLGSSRPGAFTAEHEQLLASLAEPLANAIENARLYETLREQARTLSLMHEISRELTSILDRQELLRRVAERIRRLVPYHVFGVRIWNPETEMLESVFAMNQSRCLEGFESLPLGHGLCGTAAALRQSVRVADVNADPRYLRCNLSSDVRSELVVPLVYKDRLVGVIDLESAEYGAFTEQHEQLLSTLASTIAIALENARLYEQVRGDEQRLHADLDRARKIQRQLLPSRVPSLAGAELAVAYLPARHLGGDFYDFLHYGEGRVALAVGDVSGKATAAALYGSLAIGTLREHAIAHPCPPAEMLAHLNQRFHRPEMDAHFVAMLMAMYDATTRTLTLANAGFPMPVLVRDGAARAIRIEGTPLGLLPGSDYREEWLELVSGDVLVICSDGISEASDSAGDELGVPRLCETAIELARTSSASQIAEGVMRLAERQLRGNGHSADDRTVVVLKVS
jgi:sigma-B regulation protein RsbU (phosphoserine phosphatase)